MNRTAARAAVIGALVLVGLTPAAAAQDVDSYVALLRSDIQTEKVAVMTEAMMLTPEQSEVFWPLYREYQGEVAKIGDERVAMIKDYAQHFENLTPEKAQEIARSWFDQQERRLKLLKTYHGKVEKALEPVAAARFVQVENALQQMIDLKVAANLPLIR
jgi:hypothetical protein